MGTIAYYRLILEELITYSVFQIGFDVSDTYSAIVTIVLHVSNYKNNFYSISSFRQIQLFGY